MNDDMSSCQGNGCDAASKCARYAPEITYIFQDYFKSTPGKDETCKSFTAI